MINNNFLNTFYSDVYSPESMKAFGGRLNYAQGGDLTEYKNGGTHEQNPNGGIPLMGNKRVEQGETRNGNYIYSDRLVIDDSIIKEFGLPKKAKGKTFAQYSKSINGKYTRENDAYEDKAKQQELDNLKTAHDSKLQSFFTDKASEEGMELDPNIDYKFAGGLLMAAPIVASGVNLAMTARNKPEAKEIDMFNTNTEFKPNLINRDQIKRDITSSEATAAYDLRNASGGNAGRYLANRVALNNQANTNLAQANLQSDMADSQEFARVEGLNFQQDSANKGREMQVTNWNDADKAAYQGALQDSIAGLGNNLGGLGTQLMRKDLTNQAYGLGRYATPNNSSLIQGPTSAAESMLDINTMGTPTSVPYNPTLGLEGNFKQFLQTNNTNITPESKAAFLKYLRDTGMVKEANEFEFLMSRI